MKQQKANKQPLNHKTNGKRQPKPEQIKTIQGKLCQGTFSGKKAGYGFVSTGEEGVEDILVPAAFNGDAMDGDQVEIRLLPKEREYHRRRTPAGVAKTQHRRGQVMRILKRANETMLGTVYKEGNLHFLVPMNRNISQEIVIPLRHLNGAKDGDWVSCSMLQWPQHRHSAKVRVEKVFGAQGEKGVDIRVLAERHGLELEFPDEVRKESQAIAQRGISQKDLEGRRDLRDWTIVTIDGEDAKDLDDGVSIQQTEGGWRLGVHIADVSYYVWPGSALDKEAMHRGTSVYLPSLVLPMLPPELSNGLCSLNAGVDRLAMSCVMEVGRGGKIAKWEIFPSVIQVEKRMSYSKVSAVLNGEGSEDYLPYQEFLLMLAELCKARQTYRHRRGSINFDFPEAKVITDDVTGEVLEIQRRNQGLAEQLIEEAMICANEAVATEYHRRQIPFVYRVHQGPAGDKLIALNEVLSPLGHPLSGQDIQPKDIQRLLEAMADSPYRPLVELAALRSMPHAYYDIDALGHFGLASKYYSHFTSPIRRYADLSIHRVIHQFPQDTKCPEEGKKKLQHLLSEAALAASLTEKNAETAEREAVDLLCCKYMAGHVGETFCGAISGSNNFGIYVELDNTVEGMIPLASLPEDAYDFSPKTLTLQGKLPENRFALGDRLEVSVERVDVGLRRIDFGFVARIPKEGKKTIGKQGLR